MKNYIIAPKNIQEPTRKLVDHKNSGGASPPRAIATGGA